MFNKLKALWPATFNFPLLTFIAFTIKVLVVNVSFPDAIVLLGLTAGFGYFQYLKRFQPYKLEDAIVKDLLEVKQALSRMNLIRSQESKTSDKKFF